MSSGATAPQEPLADAFGVASPSAIGLDAFARFWPFFGHVQPGRGSHSHQFRTLWEVDPCKEWATFFRPVLLLLKTFQKEAKVHSRYPFSFCYKFVGPAGHTLTTILFFLTPKRQKAPSDGLGTEDFIVFCLRIFKKKYNFFSNQRRTQCNGPECPNEKNCRTRERYIEVIQPNFVHRIHWKCLGWSLFGPLIPYNKRIIIKIMKLTNSLTDHSLNQDSPTPSYYRGSGRRA